LFCCRGTPLELEIPREELAGGGIGAGDAFNTKEPRTSLLVTTGLDPVVHADFQLTMDCQIKFGNDGR
jgi:hypothetical protein